ncbi:hypothetical protein QUF80_23025 [Desulfococcaceae bacterium HSG8]|nr:hypothetical protein [Desulfococcaceae bacterium HSG8]
MTYKFSWFISCMMIPRKELIIETNRALASNPVAAILGPGSVGKPLWPGMISQETESVYFDLEDTEDFLKLTNPKLMFRIRKDLSSLMRCSVNLICFPFYGCLLISLISRAGS